MTAIDIPGSINRGGPHLFSSGNLVGNGQRIQYVYVKLRCLYAYIHILYCIHIKHFRFRSGDQLPSLPSGRMSRLLSLKHAECVKAAGLDVIESYYDAVSLKIRMILFAQQLLNWAMWWNVLQISEGIYSFLVTHIFPWDLSILMGHRLIDESEQASCL